MKITLTKNSVEWTGEWNLKKIRFCRSVLRQLKVTGDMVNLEISLFAEKGYSQIDLTRGVNLGCWRWRFPKRPNVIGNGDTSCFYFPFDDNTIDDMMTELGFREVNNLLGCSLWVKFVTIPKLQKSI